MLKLQKAFITDTHTSVFERKNAVRMSVSISTDEEDVVLTLRRALLCHEEGQM